MDSKQTEMKTVHVAPKKSVIVKGKKKENPQYPCMPLFGI